MWRTVAPRIRLQIICILFYLLLFFCGSCASTMTETKKKMWSITSHWYLFLQISLLEAFRDVKRLCLSFFSSAKYYVYRSRLLFIGTLFVSYFSLWVHCGTFVSRTYVICNPSLAMDKFFFTCFYFSFCCLGVFLIILTCCFSFK